MKVASAAFFLAIFLAIVRAELIDQPNGELLRLPDGSFVGTSRGGGGKENFGTIFRVSANADITVLASFTGDFGVAKGANPRAGLARDPAGVLWGTTERGGEVDLGTIFKFTPEDRKLTTVVEFGGATTGGLPGSALVRDAAGNFLGTTRRGGANDFGTLFKLDPVTGALTKLVEFTGTGGAFRGRDPRGGLYIDAAGVIWGTTGAGGAPDLGTVFKLDGTTFTTVVEFTGTGGSKPGILPDATLFASAGKLWGTTTEGGPDNAGTVFSLDPATFAFASVVSFSGSNGANPRGPLVAGAAGTLLGTTENGGTAGLGTIFSLNVSTVALTTITHFTGNGTDAIGAHPRGGLTVDSPPGFVGTTAEGGRLNTGAVFFLDATTLVAAIDSNPLRGPKAARIAVPRNASGAPGVPMTVTGTVSKDPGIVVLVSINGGPFVAATIVPGGNSATWSANVTPENGTNVIVVKTRDDAGAVSLPKTVTFEYTTVRPERSGAYAGIATPVRVASPFARSGVLNLNVLPTGRFTGKLLLGGLAGAVVIRGSFTDGGVARFGKTASPLLAIPRKDQSPLTLDLALDNAVPFTGILTGTISENSTSAATIAAAQGVYSAKSNPPLPFINVPTALLNPLTDKGAYTGVFRALAPTANRPAEKFPQGDGIASLKLAPTGLVKLVARLADGTAVSAGGPLVGSDRLPFFATAYLKGGGLTGEIRLRDVPGQSDADGPGVRWMRPANPKALNYRDGWSDGLLVDFAGSKFVVSKTGALTPLGNPPATTANALLTLASADFPTSFATMYPLAISARGQAQILAPVLVATPLASLAVALSPSGFLSGRFRDPVTNGATKLIGVALQKPQVAAGYFLTGPEGDQKSAHLEISTQP